MPSSLLRAALCALVCVLAICVGVSPASAADTAAPLRVMSFNVRVPVDTDGDKRWKVRRSAMVALLRQTHPDVFGTQELVREQADYLTRQLPHYRWFGQGRRGDDSDEHMGVFYDTRALKVIESGNFWLSDTPEVAGSITWGQPLPRMVTWALFERRSDQRRFYLFNTHFPYRDEDEPARERSAKLILSRIAQLPADIPLVLTGDFNSDPDKITYRTLTAVLADARVQARTPRGPENTFQDFTTAPMRRIDWILSRGLTATDFATLDDRPGRVLPSDHYPVLAEFAWPH
ncbi:endonuclease/exonuclease/phosphatase family protein [Xanthomonas maliensis]|uniref:endonuclease/exonuclease/phosphatase family protein n=1 Tax=Xanthomonas maliensis TaxID=1321368 RepID=UPI0004CEF8EE|nr:endonuclease/exonuclease/phosphatase family protein [Xanthomonas maliensis]KAB7767927.1 endonuclease [Xanthomonas maliensis]